MIDIAVLTLAQQQPAPQGPGLEMLIGLPLIIIVFYAIVLSGNRKQKRQRAAMLAAIKKNDRVMTIGGIIGTVVNVKDTEVTLKVDETNNVKITVIRGAIQRVLAEGESPTDVQ